MTLPTPGSWAQQVSRTPVSSLGTISPALY